MKNIGKHPVTRVVEENSEEHEHVATRPFTAPSIELAGLAIPTPSRASKARAIGRHATGGGRFIFQIPIDSKSDLLGS